MIFWGCDVLGWCGVCKLMVCIEIEWVKKNGKIVDDSIRGY